MGSGLRVGGIQAECNVGVGIACSGALGEVAGAEKVVMMCLTKPAVLGQYMLQRYAAL